MIIKKKEIPIFIKKLQALLRRLPENHAKVPIIKETLSKHLAGFKGENSLDYHLSFLPEKRYYILHDIRLFHKEYYFQIDTLILAPSFILIVEVKNIAGTLFFDPVLNQFTRTLNGKDELFPNPILQTTRQETRLKDWLHKNKFPEIPIASIVISSHPKAIIRTTPNYAIKLSKKVIHSDFIPERIAQFEKDYSDDIYSNTEQKKLIRTFLKKHTPKETSILTRFQLTETDLLIGVQCPTCHHSPMKRAHGYWFCPLCSSKSKHAHKEALTDYSLLVKSTIACREAMNYLHVSSPYVCSRLLRSTAFTFSGTKKGRLYFLIES
ncbi:nuclease-related domain-containing protein [Halalkalibacter okhensis]|uniref:NERD domain-containing protein n=1 Tax=Halalkalibacter okhensis TaxID=333138 RepID=A0A0B0IEB6_9BACI|nr:nuclease-related domain-containing protein [Halalkalibacter okhensis]KHF38364.1 hypothetical protein LQ50_21815 [Halalkalibacter okhensis]